MNKPLGRAAQASIYIQMFISSWLIPAESGNKPNVPQMTDRWKITVWSNSLQSAAQPHGGGRVDAGTAGVNLVSKSQPNTVARCQVSL